MPVVCLFGIDGSINAELGGELAPDPSAISTLSANAPSTGGLVSWACEYHFIGLVFQ
jgi:phage-related protein